MASSIVIPTADRIVTVLEGLALTPAFKAYRWAPGAAGMSKLPAAVVELPTVARGEELDRRSQLGAEGWEMSFPVSLYFDLREAQAAADRAAEYVEAFIVAVDAAALSVADPTIVESFVADSEPVVVPDEARPMLRYECTLELFKVVI